jgi:streptomycin 6-kinase
LPELESAGTARKGWRLIFNTKVAAMIIPERLKWLQRHKAGRSWLASLPKLVSDLAEKWALELAAPFEGANVSYVAPAIRGAERVVLKVQWPHEECVHEADALSVWDGAGAARLLAHDAERHALLIERCLPGTCLASDTSADALGVLIELLPRLWKAVGSPFKPLTLEALGWAATLHADWQASGRPCERRLVDAATEFIDQLCRCPGPYQLR